MGAPDEVLDAMPSTGVPASADVVRLGARAIVEAIRELHDPPEPWDRPSMFLSTELVRSGTRWACTTNPDAKPHSKIGLTGWGPTPERAMQDFDRRYREG